MNAPHIANAIARSLVFAAWADGRVTIEEHHFLQKAFDSMHGLSEADRRECMAMLNVKPLQSEALVALKELRRATSTKEEREFALITIHEVMEADGEVSPEEIDYLNKLDKIINGDEELFYSELSRIVKELSF